VSGFLFYAPQQSLAKTDNPNKIGMKNSFSPAHNPQIMDQGIYPWKKTLIGLEIPLFKGHTLKF